MVLLFHQPKPGSLFSVFVLAINSNQAKFTLFYPHYQLTGREEANIWHLFMQGVTKFLFIHLVHLSDCGICSTHFFVLILF